MPELPDQRASYSAKCREYGCNHPAVWRREIEHHAVSGSKGSPVGKRSPQRAFLEAARGRDARALPRSGAARLRSILGRVTDPAELSAIEAMIDELERRAKVTDNGNGAS
jgi:transposase-like protein